MASLDLPWLKRITLRPSGSRPGRGVMALMSTNTKSNQVPSSRIRVAFSINIQQHNNMHSLVNYCCIVVLRVTCSKRSAKDCTLSEQRPFVPHQAGLCCDTNVAGRCVASSCPQSTHERAADWILQSLRSLISSGSLKMVQWRIF